MSVKGESKTKYISILRDTLNDIFNSYRSRKPELEYRIEDFGQIPQERESRNPLWLPDSKILTHSQAQVPYFDDRTLQHLDLHYTVINYNITAQTLISGQGNQFLAQSIHNTFNFHECNIGLQSNLNDLARSLSKAGHGEEAVELKTAAEALEKVEKSESPEEIKKTGLANRLKRLVDELADKDSKLHRTVEGIKYGVGIAQDIAKGYNDIAQWLGMPQVPKPFLKK